MTSKYSFIPVPLKHTSDVDLVKPLTSYIDTVYNTSDDNKPEIAEAVQELNKLRTKACCSPLDRHQSALDVLTRYYDQLVAIENKIIISATQNPVVFKWKDAFDKGGLFFNKASLSIADGSYERACVLFNCGALMSQIAAAQPMVTDEEVKTATKLFQQAAGIFARLRDTVLGLVQQDPTPDLMPDTLATLSAIMLAQAQESIYIKAAKDKMKSSALVKIAAQAADFYGDAQKLMAKEVVKGLWEKEWTAIVTGKQMGLTALAQVHQGEVHGEEHKIGQQLSRLEEAIRLSQNSIKYLPTGAIADALVNVPKALAAAKKDNDFIYHERVAAFSSLDALPRAALVKALPVVSPITPRFKDMFSSLVPVQVLNAMESYKGKKGEIVNIESSRLREHTQLMNGILASLNLPAALDDVTSSETLPDSIKQKSAKVKAAGGMNELQRLFNELPSLYKRNEEIIDETHRMLNEEKESDDNLRRQFAQKWSRMSSEQLTTPLVQEVGKYRGILHTASSADKMVREKYEGNRAGIELLSRNEVDLRSSIPGQQPHAVGGTTEAVKKLRSLMEQVQVIKTERETLEKDLKDANCDIANDFMKALAAEQLLNEESISKEKIQQIYGPLKEKVNNSVKQQENVMAEIETWNNRFTGEKTGSASGAERERTLKQLAAGFDAFNELKGNLEEGTKFYNDLTPILVRLQQKVSDFVFARQTEKEDLMRQMQQSIVSGGAGAVAAGSAGAVPPPRPPPPSRPTEASAPTAPPRTQSHLQGEGDRSPTNPFDDWLGPTGSDGNAFPQQQQQQQPQQFMQQAPQMPPYYQQQVPYGQPQPMFYPPQYQQPNFNPQQPNFNPYMTFPGAYPQQQYQQPQQGYGQFPMAPQQQMPHQPFQPQPGQQMPPYNNQQPPPQQ